MPSSQYLSLAYINSKKEFAPIGHEEDFCKRIDDEKQNIKNDFFSFYPELWNKIYDIKENIEEAYKLRDEYNEYWGWFYMVDEMKGKELSDYCKKYKIKQSEKGVTNKMIKKRNILKYHLKRELTYDEEWRLDVKVCPRHLW